MSAAGIVYWAFARRGRALDDERERVAESAARNGSVDVDVDVVGEASEESFPASDPPTWGAGL